MAKHTPCKHCGARTHYQCVPSVPECTAKYHCTLNAVYSLGCICPEAQGRINGMSKASYRRLRDIPQEKPIDLNEIAITSYVKACRDIVGALEPLRPEAAQLVRRWAFARGLKV